MTSDQAPVLWPFISAPGLPPTGAQMGIDLLSGGSLLRRPARLGPRRHGPGHQPEHVRLRQTRPRQVRHGEGVPAADDGLRLPRPHPGRPEGRVRAAVPGVRGGAVRDRPGPAGPDQPARLRPARPRLGPARRAPRRRAGRRSSSAAGSPWSAAWSAANASASSGCRSAPPTRSSSRPPWPHLTGYTAGNTRMREVTIPQLWHALDDPTDRARRRVPLRATPALPRRDPAAARRPRAAGLRRPGRPVRRPHHHRRRLAGARSSR